jgi:hypothetical protein
MHDPKRVAAILPAKEAFEHAYGGEWQALWAIQGKQTVLFWVRFQIEMIILPRPPRDKHRESTPKTSTVFLAVDEKSSALPDPAIARKEKRDERTQVLKQRLRERGSLQDVLEVRFWFRILG